ncbi:CRISPR-associated RAMP protein, Cmr1 family [Desulfofarcimen acetoxidans DSM 771]|uniref:CRISPR-associated RAMP protein, Cmr1 family n=1 Tax=Desulfofarcimen acetoxidans (strain ATCC 49208 / DSM 771 / KCTC 5769 / VKM B-1644 / 5575) TaxID=485916 RepID=C8W3E8_DESAS|nr:type III-B CRISPR module RAMP protein Cmr1 [Desulfofarcimen acetoxidans]ACV63734.1 CRISPR-associated RAMP protein, Cmr1 family [Desulfofarcimen acetoxidans DSM 771]
MNNIRAVYQVVTPLFMGGANPVNSAELRPPSFKGVMRFWYRAVTLPKYKDWSEVKKKEQELFGSTDSQARFLIRLKPEGDVQICDPEYNLSGDGKSYLGYGLIKPGKNQKTVRAFIKQNARFSVTLTFRKLIDESDRKDLIMALQALGLFGGLGSRSRRGFGSACLESLELGKEEVWSAPLNTTGLRDRIEIFLNELGDLSEDLPEYTAFSRRSRVIVLPSDRDETDLFDKIGRELISYRSYGIGRDGIHMLPWNVPAEQIFSEDHDLVYDFYRGKELVKHPCRSVFGLPHNYRVSGCNVSVNAEKQERRASPLFIHLHLVGGKFAAVISVLPAVYLPEGEKIKISLKQKLQKIPVKVDYSVLYNFLERFPDRLEVRLG